MTLYERSDEDIDRGLVGYWKLDDLKRKASDGIIAHYKMNDNAADTDVIDSKGGNTGTCSVNTDTLSAAGKINEAIDFTGSENIAITDTDNFGIGNKMTICFWASIDDFTTVGGIASKRENDTTNRSWDIFSGTTNNRFRFAVSSDGTDVGSAEVTSNTNLNNATLYHVVCVANGTDIRIIINGALDSTPQAFTGSIFSSVRDVLLGIVAGSSGFAGLLDDFRIYDRDLSLAEAQTIYNSGSGTETTELFRDTIVAIDRANFNDGTITGCSNTEGINGLNPDAMFFDGVDDDVTTTLNINDVYSENNALTICFWAKVNNDLNVSEALLSADDAGDDRFYFRAAGGNLQFTSSDRFMPVSPTDATDWNHYIMTVEPTISKVYLNGEFKFSAEDVINTAFGNSNLRLGRSVSGADRLDGTLRSVRVYNRALTAGERSKIVRLKL